MIHVSSTDIQIRQIADNAVLALPDTVREALGRAAELVEASHAPATIEAYRLDMADWTAWTDSNGVVAWPVEPPALAAYIGHLEIAGKSVSTISRRCSAISRLCRDHGLVSPTRDPMIERLLKGLRRAHPGEEAPKRAFTPDVVRAFLLKSTSIRDRALVAVGFVTGLRRSELLSLAWTDLGEDDASAGLTLRIRFSKTDQTGEGAYVGIPRISEAEVDPCRLILAWRATSTDRSRIFPISESTILRICKRVATISGLDPAHYGSHSMRAGLCTTAARAGVSLAESMRASRHRSVVVAASYVRTIAATQNRAHIAAADALLGR